MSYSRTQAQGAASRAKTQMGGQSQKSQSGPEARPPDSKFEPFPVYTITTLMESMARATLDEGFAGRGELILFYGPPKHGKAFLASQFAVSVAVGANWFGRKCAFERFRTVRQNATPHWLARKSLRNRCRGKVTRKIARPRIVPGPGRPTAYNRATADSALEWLASGKSLRSWSAADPSRPHASTNIKWALRTNDNFGALYREARRCGAEVWADELNEIADQSVGGDMATVQARKLQTEVRTFLLAPSDRRA